MAPPLPPVVRRLGGVSLLTDASSEMIYPLLPAFLTGTLHAGPAFLGLVEGVAEAAASLLKIASGALADRLGRAKPLVVAGYSLSAVVRPCMALAGAPAHVLAIRLLDRVGKGVRGAPRDALVAGAVAPQERGRAFGFHRAMDNAGAVLGPLIAAAALAAGFELRAVFALALVPGLLSVLVLVLGVSDGARGSPAPRGAGSRLSPGFARYLAALGVFTLGNSSDAFLILRAQELGVPLVAVPLLWMFHHVVKAGLGTPLGALSDRLGRKRAIAFGWVVYALSYVGFAAAHAPLHAWLLFGLYGVFHAATEGAERALVADLVPEGARGRAFGWYHAVTGAALLPASLLTGALWHWRGAGAALGTGAALAACAAGLLLALVPTSARRSERRS
ncbi:MAG TPA: MFS transporter [Vicinamibacteria bacterium]|nr:MFS transporter [Vicinamibacteria bacterium]